jgi:hypothetical protein
MQYKQKSIKSHRYHFPLACVTMILINIIWMIPKGTSIQTNPTILNAVLLSRDLLLRNALPFLSYRDIVIIKNSKNSLLHNNHCVDL